MQNINDTNTSELPSAYRITRGEKDGRFYPRRFGALRRNSVNGPAVSFGLYSEAVAYCRAEQREYERRWPAPSDKSTR